MGADKIQEVVVMGKSVVTMLDLVTGMIEGGQLTPEDEASLRELFVERAHAREGMSLAGYIKREAGKVADIRADHIREMHTRLYRYCIRGDSIGDKSPDELTEDDIRKYIIHTAVSYEMDQNSWYVFLRMLQRALNAMSYEGVLSFSPPIAMDRKFWDLVNRKHCVERPYDDVEWGKIGGWLEQNPLDVHGLALALWFEGKISPGEIIGLKKSYLMDYSGEYSVEPVVLKKNESEDYLRLTSKRRRIIRAALDMYPGADQKYIFMAEGKKRLKKLVEMELQEKLKTICRETGVKYKPLKSSEMILWGLH